MKHLIITISLCTITTSLLAYGDNVPIQTIPNQNTEILYLNHLQTLLYAQQSESFFDISPKGWDIDAPPYDFYMKKDYLNNTLCGNMSFWYSDSVSITVRSSVPCILYFFNENNLNDESYARNFNHYYSAPWQDENQYTATFAINNYSYPYSFVLVSLNGQDGIASVYIKGNAWDDLTEEEIELLEPDERERSVYFGKVTNAYIPCPQTFNANDSTYNIFTAQSQTDMRLCAIKNGRVYKFNDNYQGTGTHNWGTEARIKFTSDNIPNGIIAYSLNQTDTMKTNLFVGCKSYSRNLFPLLNDDDGFLCAPNNNIYNCVSWAIGTWRQTCSLPSIIGFEIHGSINSVLMNEYGLTTVGATEENSVVDLWVYEDEAKHFSIKGGFNGLAHSYSWESKIGDDVRFMHPRYALTLLSPIATNTEPYGEVKYHLITTNNYMNNFYTRWNCNLDDTEIKQIESLIEKNTQKEKDVFNHLYNKINNIIKKKNIISLKSINKLSEYKELISLCINNNDKMIGLAMEKLLEGDDLPFQIIGDLTISDNKDIIDDVKAFYGEAKEKYESTKTLPTTHSLEILYVKGLLKKMNNKEDLKQIFTSGNTLSTDENIFQIMINNTKLTITFDIGHKSTVSLGYKNINKQYGKTFIQQKLMEQGQHQVVIDVNENGIYTIDLVVNGNIYSKKIII